MFTLYVARDRRDPARHDTGSVLCLQLLPHLAPDTVSIEECTSKRHPAWCRGTPTLYDIGTGDVWEGFDAIEALQTMALEFARKAPPAASAAGARRPPASAASATAPVTAASAPPGNDPWAITSIQEVEDEEEADGGDKKITQDDLQRFMQSRGN